MSENNECKQLEVLSRRDFFKVAAGATAAVAVASVALPGIGGIEKAFAAPAALAPGTYTVTANIYADKSVTPIGQNAYITNPGNPPGKKPTTPVSNNATLEVKANGDKFLTVPIVNNTFGVTSFGTSSNPNAPISSSQMGTWSVPFGGIPGPSQRVTSVTFNVTNFTGTNLTATITPCAEYVTFILYYGYKNWDLHLVADLTV